MTNLNINQYELSSGLLQLLSSLAMLVLAKARNHLSRPPRLKAGAKDCEELCSEAIQSLREKR